MIADEPKKKRKNSRQKGASFERQVATRLREWLGYEWTVTRNPTDWQKNQVESHAGEFTFDGPVEFPYVVECKAHESFDYGQLWTGVGPFPKFWGQAVAQAESGETPKKPMLIFKRNFGPTLVAIPDVPLGVAMTMTEPPVEMHVFISGCSIVVMTLDRFLSFRSDLVLGSGG